MFVGDVPRLAIGQIYANFYRAPCERYHSYRRSFPRIDIELDHVFLGSLPTASQRHLMAIRDRMAMPEFLPLYPQHATFQRQCRISASFRLLVPQLRACRHDGVFVVLGRVGMWRGDGRFGLSVTASFVWRCLTSRAMAPFPHPSHRTGLADFPHPALGQDLTPSPTTRHAQAWSSVRARSARRGVRVDMSHPCVA